MAISQYIQSNIDSNIDTWYIACNRFDSECTQLLCDALAYDTKVKALWLKRNPILAAGAVHIARMLTTNMYLETLDLLNTGLFDNGCELLFEALKVNHTLKNLDISANGLTIRSGQIIRIHFENGHNHLETLTVSCNALGDIGILEMAKGLKHDQCLKRLGIESNCIGAEGARALVDAGADVNIADGRGVRPLSLARERGYGEIVEILEAAGARPCPTSSCRTRPT